MMAVADAASYVAILATIGLVPLAVTTSLNINFLRRPSANAAIVGEATLLKAGRRLVVAEVTLFSEGDSAAIAHATTTYSIPS
jgi:acyl-coenzyme A thioesterase PaaI-like protein